MTKFEDLPKEMQRDGVRAAIEFLRDNGYPPEFKGGRSRHVLRNGTKGDAKAKFAPSRRARFCGALSITPTCREYPKTAYAAVSGAWSAQAPSPLPGGNVRGSRQCARLREAFEFIHGNPPVSHCGENIPPGSSSEGVTAPRRTIALSRSAAGAGLERPTTPVTFLMRFDEVTGGGQGDHRSPPALAFGFHCPPALP